MKPSGFVGIDFSSSRLRAALLPLCAISDAGVPRESGPSRAKRAQ